jgi:thioesterase domain-containing protein/acyl carrier protein
MTDVAAQRSGVTQSWTSGPVVTALEYRVLQICQELLETDRVGLDDDIFSAGGTSMQAADLVNRLERELGRPLDLTLVSDGPTLRELASRLSGGATTRTTSLVRLAGSTQMRALFCVHGMGGHVLVFTPLAQALSERTQFFAFESLGRNHRDRADRSVPAMAARYVAEMRELQPHGPYNLAGYSMGGVIALEMAVQLDRHGETVAFLGMIDTDLTEMRREPVRDRAIEFVSRALGVTPPVCMPYTRLEEAVRAIHADLCFRFGEPAPVTVAQLRNFVDVYLDNEAALEGYQVPDYSGVVTLLCSSGDTHADITPSSAGRLLGWDKALPRAELRCEVISGDHWTIFTSGVSALAAVIDQAL